MKVLLAYDGSKGADAAVLDLWRAGLPSDTQAIVLAVADVWLPPADDQEAGQSLPIKVKMARAQAKQALAQAQATAGRGADQVQAMFPTWTIQAEAVADSPAWALVKKADAWDADLIVVGSLGHSTLEQILLGSVSQQVLSEARCSVRVARDGSPQANQPVRLVVGMDGSPGAQAALQAVTQRHWAPGSHIHVVSVVDQRMSVADVSITHVVENAASDLQATGLRVSTLATEGDPKHIILAEARDFEADCIFVGASGLTRLGYVLMGTVSSAVAARARCSVEVVRVKA